MKILFVYYGFSSFVKNDYDMMKKHFDVEKFQYQRIQDIFKMFKAVKESDCVYSWFATGHSFLAVLMAKILRKHSVVVAGGGDVACEPEINYGQFNQSLIKRLYTCFVLKHADIILAVSNFTKMEANMRAPTKQLKMVYNGVDAGMFAPNGNKSNNVITVASGLGSVIKLKGLDTFVSLSSLFPEYNFYILGCSEEDKAVLEKDGVHNNLTILGRQSQNELIKYYQQAKVYCQLSYRESFGMALAEAMSCGCVPVVTDRGALPEVVCDTGFIVPYSDMQATKEATKEAIENALNDNGEEARKRIIHNFSLDSREKELMCILDFLSRDKGTQIRLHKSVKVSDVQQNDKILDLGCGNKILKAILPEGIEYTGIDMLEEADILYNLEEGIPAEIQNNEYDIIFLNEVIEHIENFRTLLSECKNILSENGRIIISTPSNNRILLFGEDKDHIHCFRKTNMKHLAKKTGFVIKDMYGTYIHFPPLPYIGHPFKTNQTWYSDVMIYKLEKNHEQ